MGVHIRALGAHDDPVQAGEVVRAGYFALPDYPHDEHYDVEIGDVAGRRNDTEVFVAEVDGCLVGCLTFVAEHTNPYAEHGDPGAASFRYFAIAPSAQGLGVGEAMVRFVIDRARALGKERLRIHTLTVMVGAMRVYERLGFRRDPSHDGDWDGVVGVAYVLDL